MSLIRLLLAGYLLGAASLLVGCASLRGDTAATAEQSTEFLVHGRLSLRQVGKPVLLATFEWVRGNQAAGWTERLSLRNEQGLKVMTAEEVDGVATLRIAKKVRKVASLDSLVRTEFGIAVDTQTLAGWLNNQNPDGTALEERFDWQGVAVEVMTRGKKGRPARLSLRQGDNIMLLAVTKYVE